MHEMSYIMRLAKMAIDTATNNNAKSVESVSIQVGEMTGLIPEYLKRYYPKAVQGTILEGSMLQIEYLPVLVRCRNCNCEYHPDRNNEYLCPSCRGSGSDLLNGREFLIKNIVIND
ncbi:hydrogenase maturation nickel metallochaperone HypA [Butyrivibrio fibrisolvens]|uniref:hydrogenase maturation nickel metallochaperone HypA/HybF n=1 Tax=Butyrivibrio fibrisolvens TaxID=831 RepID=UPI00048712D0|nr:hydrogenase maturation nickel metallochaperone HypA [Butyrivibrio fibrisolvens]